MVQDVDAERLIGGICRELAARGFSERLLGGPAGRAAAAAVREALEGGARLRLGRLEFNAGGDRLYGPVILDHVRPEMSAARMDLFVPLMSVLRVADDDEAVRFSSACPYGLSAAIFGPTSACRTFARRLDVGCVVMNDVIVSTADPRVSFGGRHWSGFGVTRGPAGNDSGEDNCPGSPVFSTAP
jgi:aldehyde dehydrogenase (NAD+)